MSFLGNSYLDIGVSELCHSSEAMQRIMSGPESYSVILRQRQQKYALTNFSQEGQVKVQSKQLIRKMAPKGGTTISLISHVLPHSGPLTNNMNSDYDYVREGFRVYLFLESLYYKDFFSFG